MCLAMAGVEPKSFASKEIILTVGLQTLMRSTCTKSLLYSPLTVVAQSGPLYPRVGPVLRYIKP